MDSNAYTGPTPEILSVNPVSPRLIHADFLYNPAGQGLYCHSPTIMATDEGELFSVWYVYPEDECKNGTLAMARLRRGQRNWEKSRIIVPALQYSAGNPVLFQSKDGRMWLLFVVLKGHYWGDAELQGCYSNDNGHTWSQPRAMWPDRGLMVRHPPINLLDGSLLLPAYDENRLETVLLASSDNGSSWEEQYRFRDLPIIQPALVRHGESGLAIFFRPTGDPRYIWRAYSSDQGRKWSSPVRTPLPNPLSGIDAFSLGQDIVMVYNHTSEHQRYPLSISRSRDSGLSWGEPWHLEEVAREMSYPSFTVDPGGTIRGVYSYNRRMIKYVTFDADQIPQ